MWNERGVGLPWSKQSVDAEVYVWVVKRLLVDFPSGLGKMVNPRTLSKRESGRYPD